jgi:hypothetical protein
MMTVQGSVTPSGGHAERRPSAAERRAAAIASVSGQQADLKREAAERRALSAQGKRDGGRGSKRPSSGKAARRTTGP